MLQALAGVAPATGPGPRSADSDRHETPARRPGSATLFSATFRYALICLLELAEAQQTLQAGRIASKYGLSPHYLGVVLRDLRRLGMIESHKGNRGGYRLLLPPERINLLHLHASLAGSSPEARIPADLSDAETTTEGRADRWLADTSRRWCRDLEATTLADLSRQG